MAPDSMDRSRRLTSFACSVEVLAAVTMLPFLACVALTRIIRLADVRTAEWPPSELADNTTCKEKGFEALGPYQQPLWLPDVYKKGADQGIFLPVYSSHPLDGNIADESVTHAVIWIHGLAGDANTYFCDGIAAAAAASHSQSVISIAPWFGNEQVTESQWHNSTQRRHLSAADGISAFWGTTRWLSGGNNSPSPEDYTTSFDALDAIYEALVNRSAKAAIFPNLKVVTFTGYSAGAQLVSRWAFFTHHGKGKRVKLRFLVSDPGTYMYLDASRPAVSCSPASSNTAPSHVCSAFSTNTTAMQECPTYNTYKYGLSDLGSVKYNSYLAPFVDDPALVQLQLVNFRSKDVRFIFGTQDVCNCNTAGYDNSHEYCYPKGTTCAPNADGGTVAGIACCDTYPDATTYNALNVKCESQLQGQNRLQRALNFMSHVDRFYSQRQGRKDDKGQEDGEREPRRLVSLTSKHDEADDKGSPTFSPAFSPIFKHGVYSGGHNNSAFYADGSFIEWAFVED